MLLLLIPLSNFAFVFYENTCFSASGPSSILCNSFFMPFNHSAFIVLFFLLPLFTPEIFSFVCIRFLVFLYTFFTDFLIEFSFVILECLVLFVLLDPVPASFKFLFFHQYIFYLFLPFVLSVFSAAVCFFQSFPSIVSFFPLFFRMFL